MTAGAAHPAGEVEAVEQHRGWITLAVMLATIMQGVDTTIANVALPHMQGSLSATQDQISWVLTSYIVAAAIIMPLTGFVTARFGRKRVFLIGVAGFTVASLLCGAAQSLEQIVLFRLLQGVFGASLVPLSQAVLLDTYPVEKHAGAMAIWGVGVMVGPVLGPSLGGYLTEYYNWRWVFYINLPVGLLAWFGLAVYGRETPIDRERRFDGLGFGLLAVGIGALQLMLDRGELLGWFASPEVLVEAVVAGACLYLFLAHMFTAERPFFEASLFRDRNFVVGSAFIFVFGAQLYSTLALLPPFLHNLLGYPIVDVGLILAPRGLGSMVAMILVGRLARRFDIRHFVLLGLGLTSLALWEMSLFTQDVSVGQVVRTGLVQGLGLGFSFVPLSTIAFSTLPARYRDEGSGLFSLVRNLGGSIGISVVISRLSENLQANHAGLATFVHPFNLALREATERGPLSLTEPGGLALLEAEVTNQAAMLSYLQDFRFLMWISLIISPLILLLRSPRHLGGR